MKTSRIGSKKCTLTFLRITKWQSAREAEKVSNVRMKSSKDGLTPGIWDKETKQLCDEIMGE